MIHLSDQNRHHCIEIPVTIHYQQGMHDLDLDKRRIAQLHLTQQKPFDQDQVPAHNL